MESRPSVVVLKGVYFAILSQAITVGAHLVFMKNALKLGGTNGLAQYDTILGYPIAPNPDGGPFEQTRFWLYAASFVMLLVCIVVARWVAIGGLGRVLIATRDDETRLRFSGYQIWVWKTVIFVIAGLMAAIGGMLYAPQKPLIAPQEMEAAASILMLAYVALGGRGTVWGAVLGTLVVSYGYDIMTTVWPDGWMFLLGLVFIVVPIWLPGGLISLISSMVHKVIKPTSSGPNKLMDDNSVVGAQCDANRPVSGSV